MLRSRSALHAVLPILVAFFRTVFFPRGSLSGFPIQSKCFSFSGGGSSSSAPSDQPKPSNFFPATSRAHLCKTLFFQYGVYNGGTSAPAILSSRVAALYQTTACAHGDALSPKPSKYSRAPRVPCPPTVSGGETRHRLSTDST